MQDEPDLEDIEVVCWKNGDVWTAKHLETDTMVKSDEGRSQVIEKLRSEVGDSSLGRGDETPLL